MNVNMETEQFICTQTECSLITTGRCVNGLEPEDCPNRKINVLKDTIPIPSITEDERLPETIRLPWGESFSEEEISHITYRYPCRLILAIGEPSCGKSTLYAALFDSFQKGGLGEYIFASTKTPIGFEKICHLAREKCKGKIPTTERTKSHEFTYLHLAVKNKVTNEKIEHLIFADVNGERFQAAKDNDEEMIKLSVLKRADQIFFIADGGLLLSNGEKHVVRSDAWKIIDRCIQNNMINNQGVALVITKCDEINSVGKTEDITNFFVRSTQNKYPDLISKVIWVASRSNNTEVPPRTGLDDFLNTCLRSQKEAKEERDFLPSIQREFQKFKYEKI